MADTAFTMRTDSGIKRQFEEFLAGAGMNIETAVNLSAKAVLRERR